MRAYGRTRRWRTVTAAAVVAAFGMGWAAIAAAAGGGHAVPVALGPATGVPFWMRPLEDPAAQASVRFEPNATTAGGSVVAEIAVGAIPAQIPVRPSYAAFPDNPSQYFCSYQLTLALGNADNSSFAVLYTCDSPNASPDSVAPPEQGLGCFFTEGNGTPGTCTLSVDRSRNVYRLSANLTQNVAYANVGAIGIYITGQVQLDSQSNYSIPQRYDQTAAQTLASSFSFSDPAGDLATSSTSCAPNCRNSAALDAGIDLRTISGSYSGQVGQAPFTGVKLDIDASKPGPVKVGDTFSYTLTLRNGSTGVLSAAVVGDTLPAQLGFQSSSCAQNSGGNVVWSLGAVQAGASASCTLNVRVNSLPTDFVLHNAASAAFQFATGQSGSIGAVQDIGTVRPAAPAARTVSGSPTTKNSLHPSLSADGKLVAFSSSDSGYLASDKNSLGPDVFLLDRRTGAVRLLSVSDSSGAQLVGAADRPVLSGNGQAVAFLYNTGSTTSALRAGQAGVVTATTTTICVSPPNGLFKPKCLLGSNGQPVNGSAEDPSLSADGRYMAFCSAASNIPGTTDTNGKKDVFVLDQTLGQVKLVSSTSAGAQGNGDSCEAMISGDGKSVVFSSVAANLGANGSVREVFKKDLVSNALTLVSRGVDSAPANSEATQPAVSYDGKRIAFASRATNLESGVPATARNIWVYDETGAIASANKILAVRGANNALPNKDSDTPAISCNGRMVAFDTLATNLAPPDNNNKADIYLYDVDHKVVRRAVAPQAGVEPNGTAGDPVLDCEGNTMAFESEATNLSSGDPNSNDDIYGQEAPLRSDAAAITVDASFSGNWYNPGNDGHGFLIEALSLPGTPFYVTWYVFKDGQPIFLQGVANAVGNTLTVDMTTAKSTAFPVGAGGATNTAWGKVKLTFTDAGTGLAEWTPTAAGFTAGSFNLRRLTTPALIQSDAGQTLKACYSGIWGDVARPGYGLDLEVNDFDAATRLLTIYWYTYQPNGAPLWLVGVGAAANGKVTADLYQVSGAGAKFPPNYAKPGTTAAKWGSVSLQFSGNDSASFSWTSATSGYSNGSGSLKRLTSLATRGCQ